MKPMFDNWQLVKASKNAKTGRMPVSSHPEYTCPEVCPMKGSGCYGDNFRCRLNWNKLNTGQTGVSFDEFCDQIAALPDGTPWRGAQVGDQPGNGHRIDTTRLDRIVKANKGKRGFTYTHYPVIPEDDQDSFLHNRFAVREAIHGGLTVNLSANNIGHADKLAATGMPVCVILPEGVTKNFVTPDGNKVVICPAYTRKDVTCKSCLLCQKAKRGCIVGLPVHGNGKKKASAIAAA